MRWQSPGSRRSLSSNRPRVAVSPGANRNPLTPSVTRSGLPPNRFDVSVAGADEPQVGDRHPQSGNGVEQIENPLVTLKTAEEQDGVPARKPGPRSSRRNRIGNADDLLVLRNTCDPGSPP